MSARFRQLLFAVLLAADLRAAEFIFVNGDGESEGLNDPTVVAPVGSNPGTTLGAQRLAALQRVGEIWGSHLASQVPIRVLVGFDALSTNILAGAAPDAVPAGRGRPVARPARAAGGTDRRRGGRAAGL